MIISSVLFEQHVLCKFDYVYQSIFHAVHYQGKPMKILLMDKGRSDRVSFYIFSQKGVSVLNSQQLSVWPRSSYPFYSVSYYIKLVTTSWTYSTLIIGFPYRIVHRPQTLPYLQVLQYQKYMSSRDVSKCLQKVKMQ